MTPLAVFLIRLALRLVGTYDSLVVIHAARGAVRTEAHGDAVVVRFEPGTLTGVNVINPKFAGPARVEEDGGAQ
jgi:hypothetical protein